LAAAFGYAGLTEEGYRQLEIATRLSPRDFTQAANLSIEGLCHLIDRRYEEAIVAEPRAVLLRPDYGSAWRTLTASAGLVGDMDLARQALAECKRLQPNVSIAWVETYYPMVRAVDRS
jgi:adenylate cyclase